MEFPVSFTISKSSKIGVPFDTYIVITGNIEFSRRFFGEKFRVLGQIFQKLNVQMLSIRQQIRMGLMFPCLMMANNHLIQHGVRYVEVSQQLK